MHLYEFAIAVKQTTQNSMTENNKHESLFESMGHLSVSVSVSWAHSCICNQLQIG